MFLSALDSGEEQKIAANCAAMRSRRNIGYRNLFRTKTCPHLECKPAARKTSQPQKMVVQSPALEKQRRGLSVKAK